MFVQSWLKSMQSTEQHLLHQFQILFQLLLFHTMYACTSLDVLLIRPAHWEHFDPLHRFHHKRAVISTKNKRILKIKYTLPNWDLKFLFECSGKWACTHPWLRDSAKTKTFLIFLKCDPCLTVLFKNVNSEAQRPSLPLRSLLRSIIIFIFMIASNKPSNTETHKTDRNPPITNHKPWRDLLEFVEVNFCFLWGLFTWLTAANNANVSWLLNFRTGLFMKSAVT